MGNSEKMHVLMHWLSEDRLHDFQGPVQNQNVGTLFKDGQEFQDDHSRASKRAWGPSKYEALCNYPGHTQDRGIQAWGPLPNGPWSHLLSKGTAAPGLLCLPGDSAVTSQRVPMERDSLIPPTLPRPPSAPAVPGSCLIG